MQALLSVWIKRGKGFVVHVCEIECVEEGRSKLSRVRKNKTESPFRCYGLHKVALPLETNFELDAKAL